MTAEKQIVQYATDEAMQRLREKRIDALQFIKENPFAWAMNWKIKYWLRLRQRESTALQFPSLEERR